MVRAPMMYDMTSYVDGRWKSGKVGRTGGVVHQSVHGNILHSHTVTYRVCDTPTHQLNNSLNLPQKGKKGKKGEKGITISE